MDAGIIIARPPVYKKWPVAVVTSTADRARRPGNPVVNSPRTNRMTTIAEKNTPNRI